MNNVNTTNAFVSKFLSLNVRGLNRSNAEPFFRWFHKQSQHVIFCKNHTALKILHLSWTTNGVAKLSLATTQTTVLVIALINPSVNFKVEKLIPDKQGKPTILIIVTGRKSCCSRQNLRTQQCRPTSCFFQKTKPRTLEKNKNG